MAFYALRFMFYGKPIHVTCTFVLLSGGQYRYFFHWNVGRFNPQKCDHHPDVY
jgi:hypothetical protein